MIAMTRKKIRKVTSDRVGHRAGFKSLKLQSNQDSPPSKLFDQNNISNQKTSQVTIFLYMTLFQNVSTGDLLSRSIRKGFQKLSQQFLNIPDYSRKVFSFCLSDKNFDPCTNNFNTEFTTAGMWRSK